MAAMAKPFGAWSPGEVVTRAILQVGTATEAFRLRALLGWLGTRWPVTKAIRQSTHTFDPRVNECLHSNLAARVADDYRAWTLTRAELDELAAAYGEHIDAELSSACVLPTARCHLAYSALALYAGLLFLSIGVPIGLVGALMLDWGSVGIHRGMAQIMSGLYADSTTVELGPVAGYREKLLVLRTTIGGRAHGTATSGWESTAELERAVHDHVAECTPAAPGTFPDALAFCAGPMGTPRLLRPRLFGLRVLGGGIRRHEFDVTHLQKLRRFVLICWIVYELRNYLGAAAVRPGDGRHLSDPASPAGSLRLADC
jgi:hypothetical protein